MAYTKRDDIPGGPGEQVVELDRGDLIAVSCDRTRTEAAIVFRACARAIDEGGAAVLDIDKKPVQTGFSHTVDIPTINERGADACARECLLVVLGETPELFDWQPPHLAANSIRVALDHAQIGGPVDAGGVL